MKNILAVFGAVYLTLCALGTIGVLDYQQIISKKPYVCTKDAK